MSVKIELSNFEAGQLRDQWQQDLIQHQGAADALIKKIAEIDAQLSGQLSLPDSPDTLTTKSGKRKKGENFRTIETFLRTMGVSGATVAVIHGMTALPISSCNAVLKRHDDIFARGNDGLWRIKRDAHK